MLQISGLQKSFGERPIFENASLVLTPGERLALFGRNGSGKSTLLKIVSGDESHDGGTVATPNGYRIGYLRQHLEFSAATAIDEALLALDSREEERYKAEIILEGLGFSPTEMENRPDQLSGGFQIRLNLAKLLLSEPNLLLLDEPTNYLDIVSVRWLERFLKGWRGELIVISHDRSFCDTVSTSSCLVYRCTLKKVSGNSTKLFEQIAEEESLHERTRQKQAKERKRMEAFINRFRAKASKASVVQSRIKALDRMGSLEELSEEESLDFAFTNAPFHGRFLLEATHLSFGYGPDQPTLIDQLTFSVRREDRIAVIGKNGRGKSTLLKTLAGELVPTAGTLAISPNTALSFFAQTNVIRLDLENTVEAEVRSSNPNLHRTHIRSICGAMMFEGDDALKKVRVLSGGERSRVLLGKILATPSNLLLLDEPTNHLDMESVAALMDAVDTFEGAVIIVTHNEEILRRAAKRLIVFQGERPFLFEGGYDEFLDRIGWAEEADTRKGSGKSSGHGSDRKNQKKAKAQLIQERSQVLGPLKKELSRLEAEIAKCEKNKVSLEARLSDASNAQDGSKVAALSRESQAASRELEALLSRWEKTGLDIEQLEKQFAEKLGVFESAAD